MASSASPSSVPASTVLVVDDEPAICWGFKELLGDQGHDVITASTAEEGLEKVSNLDIGLVLLDVRLPGEDGISALPKFRAATGDAPIIVMTAHGDLETAVAAIRGGACDYLTKPFRLEDASKTCRLALRTAPVRSSPEENNVAESAEASLLVGRSPAMQQVFRQIALVADSDLSVLITGETGTGKELVAAAIHKHSRRSDKAYIPVAPVTFSETVIESELFGHVKGAFTGASEDRKGLFELADGGTVLLDEIGDLNAAAQVKLLRVIEQGEFTAVGDVRPRKCDVRVIAATNRDLHNAVLDGTFREDLLYRLTAVSIHLPPLRQRADDIPLLCEFFLRRLGYTEPAIAPDLARELQRRDWFGNVRELRNAIEHASVIARGRPIGVADFPPPQQRLPQQPLPQQPLAQNDPSGIDHGSVSIDSDGSSGSLDAMVESWARQQLDSSDDQGMSDLHDRMLAATEPALLRVVLEHTGGNRAAAAQLLGIHRGTLRDRMKRYEESRDDKEEA